MIKRLFITSRALSPIRQMRETKNFRTYVYVCAVYGVFLKWFCRIHSAQLAVLNNALRVTDIKSSWEIKEGVITSYE